MTVTNEMVGRLSGHLQAGRLGMSAPFAADLIRAYGKGKLSPKQAEWIGKLIDRAEKPKAAPVAEALAASVKGVFGLFERAKASGLKFPKIRLQADGEPVVLKQAGERSKYMGQVLLTDGGPFGSNRFFGRIDTSGALHAGRDMTPEVRALVGELAEKPAETAAAYGKLTGSCCFCSRKLEDARSTEVGYGPVCAEKFGLPWGE